MTETFRALCAELVLIVQHHAPAHIYDLPYEAAAMQRARAALAQPEPQRMTDEEIEEAAKLIHASMRFAVPDNHYTRDWVERGNSLMQDEARRTARVVLERCSRPAIEPVALTTDAAFVIGQTGGPPSEAERLAFEAWMRGHSWLVAGKWNGTTYVDPQERYSSVDVPAMQTRMLWAAWRDRAALGRPTIEPVPVSERLPGPEDCDAEGRCWWWIVDQPGELPHWIYCTLEVLSWTNFTAWLPHYALPVPQQQEVE
jgi:hypothetical protein